MGDLLWVDGGGGVWRWGRGGVDLGDGTETTNPVINCSEGREIIRISKL